MYKKKLFFHTTQVPETFLNWENVLPRKKLSKKFHSKFFGKVVTVHKTFWELQSRAPSTRTLRQNPGKKKVPWALPTRPPRFLHPEILEKVCAFELQISAPKNLSLENFLRFFPGTKCFPRSKNFSEVHVVWKKFFCTIATSSGTVVQVTAARLS